MSVQDSWWNISVSCLVILAASVIEISCEKADKNVNATENPTHVTAVGMLIML